jgi:TonB family protein
MNSMSEWNRNERDLKQRAMGCIGFSTLAHAGLLAAMLFTPKNGSGILNPALRPGGETSTSSHATQELHEVILADAQPAKAEPAKAEPVPETPKVAAAPVIVAKPAPKPKKLAAAKVAKPKEKAPEPVKVDDHPPMEVDEDGQPLAVAQEPVATEDKTPEAQLAPVVATNGAEEGATAPAPYPTQGEESNPAVVSVTGGGEASEAPAQVVATSGPAGAGGGSAPQAGSGGGSRIRDIGELREQPGNRLPKYPQQDRYLNRQGTTVVVGRVLPNGTVNDVYVETSSGSKLMDDASKEAFANWKFQPGQDGMVRKPFRFSLTGEALMKPAKLGQR